MRTKSQQAAIAAISLFIVSLRILDAQVGGSISGTVTDNSSAIVTAAKITIANTDTKVERSVGVNGQGFFSVPNLRPGNYSVSAAAPGFKTVVRSGVTLDVGAEVIVDVELPVGEVRESVLVSAEVAQVEQTSATLDYAVNSTTVRELPLNGRDWTQLALLEPGVGTVDQSALGVSNQRANRGLGAQLSIGGNRPQQNNYRLDGISINDYSNGGPGSILGAVLGVEAVQEFSVITNNAPANFGRTGGGVINAITRPGTDQFHGSAYEFLRNSALDARNFFDKTASPPSFRRNQFGADAGGAIIRNKTFIFGDYEGVRQSLGSTQPNTVLSAAAHAGQLVKGPVSIDPKIAPYLTLYPLPNTSTNGDTGVFSLVTTTTTREDFMTTRVDHTFSQKDSLFGTYFFDDGRTTSPDSFNNKLVATESRRQAAILEETHSFGPALVNSLRGGFSRVVSEAPKSLNAINPVAGDNTLGFIPGNAVGLINVGGLTNFPGGLGAVGEYDFHFNSFQAYDDVFLVKGTHSFKFGVSAERIDDNELGKSNPTGQYVFGSIAAFLTNQPQTFNAPIGTGITPRGIRETIVGAYFLDDWRVNKNLTLNLGMRYETASVPTEVQGKLTNLPTLTSTVPNLGSPYFSNPTKRNFEPRIGLAWDPDGNGKTSVRTAFGIYDNLPLPYLFELTSLLSAPYFENGTVSPPKGSFPTGGLALLTPATFRYAYIQPNPSRSYVMQWNFNVQREVAPGTIAMLGYAGSRGVHLPYFVNDFNMVLPNATPQGYVWPAGVAKLNPAVGQIAGTLWNTDSYYHSFQTQITEHMHKGFQVSAAYTFARSIDTGTSSLASDTFTNTVQRLFFDPKTGRGLSDFDIRHNLTVSSIWQIPGTKGSAVLKALAGGWQLGGTLRAATGTPFTPTISGDPLGMKSSSTFGFPDVLNTGSCNGSLVNSGNPDHYIRTECFAFPSPANRLGNAGRNILTGPGLLNLDTSLFKNFNVGEVLRLQFRTEFFNILNHSNFAPPVQNLSLFGANGSVVSTAGFITSTLTTSRQIQFGLKVIW
jgi:hypothetical protein